MTTPRDGDDTFVDEPTKAASPNALASSDLPTGHGPTHAQTKVEAEKDASAPSLGGSSASLAATSVAQPVEALRRQEIARTRTFVRLALALAISVSVLLAIVGGDATAKKVALAAMGVVAAATIWLGWMLRSDGGYTMGRTLVTAFACVFGAFAGIYFFGVFSPAPMILPFGLFFFSTAQSFGATLSVYLACAGAYGALALLIAFGALEDRGLITAAQLGMLDQLVIVAVVELTLLATFLIARATRRATLEAIEHHDRAVRGIAQREALLKEARHDLDRALKFGGLGRFTDTTLGSFRLGKILGRGGMGEVYEATHTATHEPAAVKLLHSHVLADPDLVRRFMREAKMVESLASGNVVRVLEIGGLEAPVPYIAMERLKGEDLADHLRRHRALTLAKTVNLLRQVGRGLEAARSAGIVHRDLKPRNLFYAEEGITRRTWKILDFGVSKLADAEGTQTKDMLVGTPGYMAPEQVNGGQVTHKTDLYALGVIAYRALTGRPAFTADRTAETLFQVVYQMPPRPSETLRSLPPDVDLALAIAMAKDPTMRFDSAADLADALESAGKGRLAPALRERAARLLEKLDWGGSSRAAGAAT